MTSHNITPNPAKNSFDFPKQFCLFSLQKWCMYPSFYTSSSWRVLLMPWTMLSQGVTRTSSRWSPHLP